MADYAPKILDGDFAPGFMVDLQQKDLRLVLDAAYASKTPLPGTSLSHELYTSLQRSGEGRLGDHALIKAIEQLARTEARAKKA